MEVPGGRAGLRKRPARHRDRLWGECRMSEGGGVSLSKVTLTKAAPSVSLSKGGARGHLRVNLNWTAKPAGGGGGFFKRLMSAGGGGIDLDLAALYELSDGSKGVVQA